MTESVGSQAYIFIWSVLGGMLIALIYDVFRIIRRAVRTKKIALYIEDFIYWIIIALILFWVMYVFNDGEMRGFFFIGAAAGVIVYALLLSRIVTALLIQSAKITFGTLWGIWKVFSYPLKIILKIVGMPLLFIAKLLGKGLKQAKRVGKTSISKASLWKKAIKIIRKKI